jgi:hypothetical protein
MSIWSQAEFLHRWAAKRARPEERRMQWIKCDRLKGKKGPTRDGRGRALELFNIGV